MMRLREMLERHMGMHIIQQCEVTGVSIDGKVVQMETTKGAIACKKIGIVVAGHSGVWLTWLGFVCQ